VKVEFSPEWLKNRCGYDWTGFHSQIIPLSLVVSIGSNKSRILTLWPKKPYVLLDRVYPEDCKFYSVFTPLSYSYQNGKIRAISFRNICHFSARKDTKHTEHWLDIDALHPILNRVCDAATAKDFQRRLQQFESSKSETKSLLEKTTKAFSDWKFTVNWMKLLKYGPEENICGHTLCEYAYNADHVNKKPFTVDEYARLVAEALVRGDQPIIEKDQASHKQIHRAVHDLYLIVGPEPYKGLGLVNRHLKEVGGKEWELILDAEDPNLQNWEPSTNGRNNPLLILKKSENDQRYLALSPRKPTIIWDSHQEINYNLDLFVGNVYQLEDGHWSVCLTNSTAPEFRKDEALLFLQDHGYDDEAENLDYIFTRLSKVFSSRDSLNLTGEGFKALTRKTASSWSCQFEIPDRRVECFDEYVQLWRSQKEAEAMGQDWVWVDQEFWLERVFESLAKGEIPVFSKWEFIGYAAQYAKSLYHEVQENGKGRKEQLAYLNEIIRRYNPEARFGSKERCKRGHFTSNVDSWNLTLKLPNGQLRLVMHPRGVGFSLG
jgi:hypothetical protein